MQLYRLVARITPAPENRYYGKARSGRAHCWVVAETEGDSIYRLSDYLLQYGWRLTEVEYVFENTVPPDLLSQKEESGFLLRAFQHGIAVDLVVSSLEDGDDSDPYILAPPC